jgi:hypothetical protein
MNSPITQIKKLGENLNYSIEWGESSIIELDDKVEEWSTQIS